MATKKITTAKKASPKAKKSVSAKVAPIAKKSSSVSSAVSLAALKSKVGPINAKTLKQGLVDHKVIVSTVVLVIAALILILPRLVVAWVDNKPVTIFEYYNALDSKYGKDEKQQLIGQKLVEDEAQKRGVSVSDAELNSQFNQIETQASGSANLQQLLTQQGLTVDQFKEQLKLQALIKKMFASSATVSAQQVDQYIQQNADQYPTVDDSVRKQVSDQLAQQALVTAFQNWLQTAETSSRVKGL